MSSIAKGYTRMINAFMNITKRLQPEISRAHYSISQLLNPISQFTVTICSCTDKGHSDRDCEIAIVLKSCKLCRVYSCVH